MAQPHSNKTRRNREVRDIVNKLRRKYKSEMVMTFIESNYFIDQVRVYAIMSEVDAKAVESPSLIYTTVMNDDFHL